MARLLPPSQKNGVLSPDKENGTTLGGEGMGPTRFIELQDKAGQCEGRTEVCLKPFPLKEICKVGDAPPFPGRRKGMEADVVSALTGSRMVLHASDRLCVFLPASGLG